jgi:hypothetical protein
MAVADGQFNVTGKLFVITGGDKGLGFQTAKRLVRETWRRSNCFFFFSGILVFYQTVQGLVRETSNGFFSSREFLHFTKLPRDWSGKLGEDQTGFFFSGILAFYRTDKRMVRETWRR